MTNPFWNEPAKRVRGELEPPPVTVAPKSRKTKPKPEPVVEPEPAPPPVPYTNEGKPKVRRPTRPAPKEAS